jgi:hypothetical protein
MLKAFPRERIPELLAWLKCEFFWQQRALAQSQGDKII